LFSTLKGTSETERKSQCQQNQRFTKIRRKKSTSVPSDDPWIILYKYFKPFLFSVFCPELTWWCTARLGGLRWWCNTVRLRWGSGSLGARLAARFVLMQGYASASVCSVLRFAQHYASRVLSPAKTLNKILFSFFWRRRNIFLKRCAFISL